MNDNNEDAPPDTGNFTFTSFLLLGLAMSVPYSSVLNATKTFEHRLDTAFFSHFSAVYLTTKFLFMVLAMVGIRKERLHKATTCAIYSLCIISFLLFIIAGYDGLNGDLLYKLMLAIAV